MILCLTKGKETHKTAKGEKWMSTLKERETRMRGRTESIKEKMTKKRRDQGNSRGLSKVVLSYPHFT